MLDEADQPLFILEEVGADCKEACAEKHSLQGKICFREAASKFCKDTEGYSGMPTLQR